MGAAFVYGTLLAPEVLQLLLKRVPPSKPAVLPGFSRHRVKGQVFPAIRPATPDDKVVGKVLLELTPAELHILDVYESEEYYRASVQPQLEDGSSVDADVYVWRDEFRGQLLDQPDWDYEEWQHKHKQAWTERLGCECVMMLRSVAACLALRRDQLLLDQPDWDFSAFMAADLPEYLLMSASFMNEAFGQQQQEQ